MEKESNNNNILVKKNDKNTIHNKVPFTVRVDKEILKRWREFCLENNIHQGNTVENLLKMLIKKEI